MLGKRRRRRRALMLLWRFGCFIVDVWGCIDVELFCCFCCCAAIENFQSFYKITAHSK